jgi:hypothetical protein
LLSVKIHSRADKWLAKADDLIASFLSNTIFVINYFIKSSIGVLIYEHYHFTPSNITKIFDKGKRKRKKNFENVRMGEWSKRFYLFIFFSGNGKLKYTF